MKAPPREFREIAREIAKDSIVTQATARLIEQIVEELHNSRINPLCDRIEKLEAALRPFAEIEPEDLFVPGYAGEEELILDKEVFLAARAALNGE